MIKMFGTNGLNKREFLFPNLRLLIFLMFLMWVRAGLMGP